MQKISRSRRKGREKRELVAIVSVVSYDWARMWHEILS